MRVAREVNQRMLGIVQGIKRSAIELQKKADQARTASAAPRMVRRQPSDDE